MDKNTQPLTVQKIFENELKWEEHEIYYGNAILTADMIKEGDIVKKFLR